VGEAAEQGEYCGDRPSLFEIMEESRTAHHRGHARAHRHWNQTEAAERFQIPLSTLNQKIKRLGIELRRRSTGSRGGPAADPMMHAAGK
jgi:DNA-binding NtrC family response regulator